jgi:hypothetical protein
MTEGLNFEELSKEQVQEAFKNLPKEKQVAAVLEAMQASLAEAEDFDQLIQKLAKWSGIVLRIAGKLV